MKTEHARIPKILGADVELGNFLEGVDAPDGTGHLASRMLLRHIEGVAADGRPPARSVWWRNEGDDERVGGRVDAQDCGRRFLSTNGGCAYIDLDHEELCNPEVTSAFDFVVYSRAMLHIAADALRDANARLSGGIRVVAQANTSDGAGHSFGAHMNLLVSREAWDNICVRKPHYLAFLAAFQISSVIYGSGKVGAENRQPVVPYQLSQRADFIETMIGPQTVYDRPLVNSRFEPLCGRSNSESAAHGDCARLHVIFFDHTLAQTAAVLKAGTLQIIGSLLEDGAIDSALALDDPLATLTAWSRDPSLTVRARTVGGDSVTAVELQWRFLEGAKRCADRGGLDGRVPRAAELLALWEDTLVKLRAGDVESLARRLDWVLKRQLLQRAIERRPGLDWTSPEIKHLDQVYASLDPEEGLFWTCERNGLVDRLVSDEAIARATREPPVDTRAWTRAHVLRLAGTDRIERIDWDRIDVRLMRRDASVLWSARRTIDLPDPAGATKAEYAPLFDAARDLDDVLNLLGEDEEITRTPTLLTDSPRVIN